MSVFKIREVLRLVSQRNMNTDDTDLVQVTGGQHHEQEGRTWNESIIG